MVRKPNPHFWTKIGNTLQYNLAFVTKAFGPDKLNQITGGSLLETYQNISFKKLKVSEKMTAFTATDTNLKLNFDRILNNTKRGQKPLHYSNTEAILEKIRMQDDFSVIEIISITQAVILVLLGIIIFLIV